jgi:hypothetical protein
MHSTTLMELNRIRNHLQTLLTGPGTQIPKTVYHYTDAAGLLGIASSRTVWATHSAYLNDASELQYAVGLMEDVVVNATKDAKPDSWKERCLHAVLQGESPSTSPHHISKRRNNARSEQVTDETQYFVACFSEAPDRLSQWRGYGKSIGGYALGFPFGDLRAIEKRINNNQAEQSAVKSNPKVTVGFGRCWYNRQAQKALLIEGFDRLLRHLETLPAPATSFDPDPIERLMHSDYWLPGVLNAIPRAVSPYFKDRAFKEEREWRLVVRVRRPDNAEPHGPDRERPEDDIRLDKVATVNFRKGEYSLVPYIVLPLVLNKVLCLSQVVVGPTPLPGNARAAAIQLLRPPRTPISAPAVRKIVCESENIVPSKIPFRRV